MKRKCTKLDDAIDDLCRREILSAIKQAGTYAGAARLLGLQRTRFYRLCHRCWPTLALDLRPVSQNTNTLPTEPGPAFPHRTMPAPDSILSPSDTTQTRQRAAHAQP